jgi:ribosome-associated toxin RatA of RatAB toxin-antitoxin module
MNGSLHQRRTPSWNAWAARSLAALACGLCVFGADDLPRVRASESREFSSEEEALLRAGKLVVRAEQRTVGTAHLLGGLSWQLIDAPAARVWRTLSDVHTYAHFLPAVEEALSMESNGSTQSLFIRHRLGFISASYWVRAVYEPQQRRVRFRLDREHPSSLRDAWGELRVTPYENSRSVVSLAIMTDLGEGLAVGLVRSNVHEWMLRVPEQLKRFVEAQRD